MSRKIVPARTLHALGLPLALLLAVAVTILSGCTSSGSGTAPTSEVESLISQAAAQCQAAIDAVPVRGRSATPQILTLFTKAYEDEQWVHASQAEIEVAGELEASRSVDVQTLVCIQERRKESFGKEYTDGQPAYTLIWDVRLVSWPGGEVLGSVEAWGGEPPEFKTTRGPGYGRAPSVERWVQASLRGETMIHLPYTVRSLRFSPDGEQLAAAFCAKEHARRVLGSCPGIGLQIWDPATGLPQKEIESDANLRAAVAYLPGGEALMLADGMGSARWFDANSGEELMGLGMGEAPALTGYTADGRWMSWLDRNGNVHIWNVENVLLGSPVHTDVLRLQAKDASSLAAAPDGMRVALGRDDGTVTLYGVEGSEVLDSRSLCRGPVHSVAYSPDGGTLAVGCSSGSGEGKTALHLWNLEAGIVQNVETRGTGYPDVFVNLAFSRDGAVLATGDKDGTVTLWDTATGTRLRELLGHTGDVTALAFSPDGATLASGDWHGIVVLWEVEGAK